MKVKDALRYWKPLINTYAEIKDTINKLLTSNRNSCRER